jgi:hypothetical protein
MKLKCTNIILDVKETEVLGATNGSLTVGKEYIVLSFLIKDKFAGFQIECDEGELIIADASQFKVLSTYIPSSWESKFHTYKYKEEVLYNMNLCPREWNKALYNIGTIKEQGFYEEIVEVDTPLEGWRNYPPEQIPEVVKLYFQEKDIIYQEEAAYEKANASGFSKPSSILLNLIKNGNSAT